MASIQIRNLRKTFGHFRALDRISLEIASGEMVGLIGASGSGKSTLLRHISGLTVSDCDDSEIEFDGRTIQCNGSLARDIRQLRAQVGFVFQQFNLVGRMPVITNVLAGMLHRVPLWRSSVRHFTRCEVQAGLDALARVGIPELAWQRASTLSGGQQQRAAIARTLVQQASAILADEPIASLDPESSRRVMEILAAINREDGSTVIVSLHQVDVALKYCPRVIAMHEGSVVFDGDATLLTPKRLREIYGAEAEEMTPSPPQVDLFPSSFTPRPDALLVHNF